MTTKFTKSIIIASLAIIGLNNNTNAQFVQQGNKLVGTGAVGAAQQGSSVSLSSDGNTAIIGGEGDNSNEGAAWIYTRSGGDWTQQGSKLLFSPNYGDATGFGCSVSLSSDGNTAIVGGYDYSYIGAAWIYIRSGNDWEQQGNQLIGTGTANGDHLGYSVSISSDGNTAIVGGNGDNGNVGAVWIYTRSGGIWTQQGSKLIGTGAIGISYQGGSVSLSSDGNTAIVGGPADNNLAGAAWVYVRSGGVWTQQGSKLVGTGALGFSSYQGGSVSLSSDGNTAIIGGVGDNDYVGAAWVFTRSGGVWTQQEKLVGTGAVGAAQQGSSVSLSSDGNIAIVGGKADNSNTGAAWVYTRFGGVWTQQGSKLIGTGATGNAAQGSSVSLSSDGSTAIIGGVADNSHAGAAWVFSTGTTTGVDNAVKSNDQLQVYPNPSTGVFTISLQDANQNYTIEVYNVLGTKVFEQLNNSPQTSNEINLSGYAKGIYFVKVNAGEKMYSSKVVVQ